MDTIEATSEAPTDDIYLTDLDLESESDNYGLPNYGDPMALSYDDSPVSIVDQPKRRQVNGGRAAPVSISVDEKPRDKNFQKSKNIL